MSTQATERMELRKEMMDARDYCLAAVNEPVTPRNKMADTLFLECCQDGHVTNAYNYTIAQRWLWCARELDRRISNLFRHEDDQIGVDKLMASDEPPRAPKKPISKCQYCGDFRPHVHVFAGDYLPPEEEASFHESASTSDRLDIERARLESLRNVCKRVLQMRDRGAFAKPEEQQLWRDFEAEVMR